LIVPFLSFTSATLLFFSVGSKSMPVMSVNLIAIVPAPSVPWMWV
jgi:hypothetical protein